MALRKALLLIAGGAALLGGCDWMKKKDAPAQKSKAELAGEQRERIRKACASDATYDRLKELVFDEAARIRNSDPRNLDPLAASAVVRMENPVVKSRDDELNVTVCSGRFILELPPGAENAFDGKRRLDAEVEYAAQAAVDGSGLVYQMDGAEPIIYRLATFGLKGQPTRLEAGAPGRLPPPPPAAVPVETALMPPVAEAAPRPAPPPPPPPPPVRTAERRPETTPAPAPATRVTVRPSFNCRQGKTRTEKMICSSPRLAAQDRAMASLYYDLMARANPATRGHLRRSRDAFLGRREQCRSESCVNSTYNSRMAELRNIGRGD
ncbi:MAG: lysozyme inhibitor LprI family protein [Allosphingosinicella sp.]